MFEIIAYSLIGLALAVGAVLLVASRRPDQFSVSRTQSIAASPERLYPLIASLHKMNTWSPFALRDPASAVSYQGPESGVGAKHTFNGKKSGTGFIEVIEANAPSNVVLRLVMSKPFACDNRIDFALKPNGSSTDVNWTMGGKQPLIAKVMTLFIDCDKMVGKEFEAGLGNLKRMAE